ncbi:TIGR04141 family sporadically distributed protein [Snodgrassella sp. B3882]|uniref:TIGR04141 family sporadically distributed protein n=1 Tax=Snodgrassella sp. B3882 TaxID=2818037 RepID=UPI00226A1AD6|nr:TIGR04141 family sporadically distributed protein [Snodgrassella sp. B3882]MCX8745733.1 TIGR04141 family sporadically distributed protein [Snodgrassella sp. B3882]
MSKSCQKKHSLNIMLLKEDIKSAADAIKHPQNIFSREIKGENFTGYLFYKISYPNQPNWINLLEPYCGDILNNLKNSSTSAVLIIETEDRYFSIIFGYGRAILKTDCYEENFGLRVTLNSIDTNKIRTIDKGRIDTVFKQERSQTSIDTDIGNFEIDKEQDILKSITGIPTDGTLGNKLTGKESLKLNISFSLEQVVPLLKKLKTLYESDNYKKDFYWIDHFREIKNKSLKNELNELLINKIQTNNFEKIWLVIPEIIDWTQNEGFKYKRDKNQGETLQDISWESYSSFDKNRLSNIKINRLKKDQVLAISATSDQALFSWSIYKCIYCELEYENKNYVLNNNQWYQVDVDFIDELNSFLEIIPLSDIELPKYLEKNEKDYNRKVCNTNSKKYCLMDKTMIHHGGKNSKIEFCDIYSNNKQLIHVKRDTGSNTLSHLFAQGRISAELLLFDAEFRKKVNAKLPESYKFENVSEKPNAKDFEIIYAIASHNKTNQKELPLFSKINLRNAFKVCDQWGFKVSLIFIKSTNEPKSEKQKVDD